MPYTHSAATADFGNRKLARVTMPIGGGSGVHSGALVDLGSNRYAYPVITVDQDGNFSSTVLAGDGTDRVGSIPRYGNGSLRQQAPQALNLWDFITDGLAGTAYVPTYKLFGLTWTVVNGNITAGYPGIRSVHDGRTFTLWRGASSTTGLSGTLTYTSPTAATFSATPTNAITSVGEAHSEGTDITTYFQAALDAAALQADYYGGCILDVPAGTWLVAGNLSIPDNVWLRGSGRNATTILLKNGVVAANTDVFRTQGFTTWTGQTAATNANRGSYGFRVSDMTINGNFRNNETNGRYGLAIFGFDYELHNLEIVSCRDSGWYTEAAFAAGDSPYAYGVGPGGLHFYVRQLKIQSCGTNSAGSFVSYSAQIRGPHDSFIDTFDVYKVGNHSAAAVFIGDANGSFADGQDSSGGLQIAQMHIWGNNTIGADINAFTGSIQIIDSQFDAPNTGLRVASNDCQIRDCYFYSVASAGAASHVGIELNGAKNFSAKDITFNNLGGGALKYTGTAASNAASTIEGEVAYDNDTYDLYPVAVTGTIPDDARILLRSRRGEQEIDFVQTPYPILQGAPIIAWEDHFDTGSSGTTGIGKIGAIASAAPTIITGETAHPGIIRLATTAVINTTHHITANSTANTGTFLPAEYQIQFRAWVRPNSTDANTQYRIGLMPDGTDTTPDNGIYFEKAFADTTWHCITRAASVETDTDSATSFAAAWTKVELYKGRSGAAPSASAWKFYINGVLEATHTTNIPTAALKVVIAQITNNAAADKTVDTDWVQFSLKTAE